MHAWAHGKCRADMTDNKQKKVYVLPGVMSCFRGGNRIRIKITTGMMRLHLRNGVSSLGFGRKAAPRGGPRHATPRLRRPRDFVISGNPCPQQTAPTRPQINLKSPPDRPQVDRPKVDPTLTPKRHEVDSKRLQADPQLNQQVGKDLGGGNSIGRPQEGNRWVVGERPEVLRDRRSDPCRQV